MRCEFRRVAKRDKIWRWVLKRVYVFRNKCRRHGVIKAAAARWLNNLSRPAGHGGVSATITAPSAAKGTKKKERPAAWKVYRQAVWSPLRGVLKCNHGNAHRAHVIPATATPAARRVLPVWRTHTLFPCIII